MGLTVKQNGDGTVTISCEDQEVDVSGDSQGSNQDDGQSGAPPPVVLDPGSGGGAFLKAKKSPRILISTTVESVDEIKKIAESLRVCNFLRIKESDTVLVRFTWASKKNLDLARVRKIFETDFRPDQSGDPLFKYEVRISHDE